MWSQSVNTGSLTAICSVSAAEFVLTGFVFLTVSF